MSVAKTVVGLVVATGLGDPAQQFLDSPVARWLSEWQNTDRDSITLRHVMTHTSGLAAMRPREIYRLSNIVAAAMDAAVESPPGKTWKYNNLVFNLLGEVVRRHTGESIITVATETLFQPLGIGLGYWETDPAGNAFCMSNMSMRAADLASLGNLFLTGGEYSGRQLVPTSWIAALPPPAGRDVGCATFAQYDERGVNIGFGHDGSEGQWLSIQPNSQLVAVRLRDPRQRGDHWNTFPADVHATFGGDDHPGPVPI